MEPDVLFSNSFSTFLSVAAAQCDADVVLPGPFISQNQMPDYSHWALNPDVENGAPPSKRIWSIVVVARYSRRMMDLLTGSWHAGLIGYEEMSVPMMCLTAPNCKLSQFGRPGYISGELSGNEPWAVHPDAPNFANGAFYSSRVQFRPEWSCGEFLAARANGTNELFHPVKDRSCLLTSATFRR